MIREIKRYHCQCDGCPTAFLHEDTSPPNPDAFPDGWGNLTTGGWGSTGYARTTTLCPDCLVRWRAEHPTVAVDPPRFERRAH